MRFPLIVLLTVCTAALLGAGPCVAQGVSSSKPKKTPASKRWPANKTAKTNHDLFNTSEPSAEDQLLSDSQPTDAARPVTTNPAEASSGRAPSSYAEDVFLDPSFPQPSPDPTSVDAPVQNLVTKVIRLERIPAEQAAATVQTVFSDRLRSGLKLVANPGQQMIVLRGPADCLKEIEALLSTLDSHAVEYRTVTTQGKSGVIQRQVAAVRTSTESARPVAGRDAAENKLQQQIRQLAVNYQALTDSSSKGYDAGGTRAGKVEDELRAAVEKAFDLRQKRQQHQVQQLQQRLASLQDRMQQRQTRRGPIVDQAVRDLLSVDAKGRRAQRRQQRMLDVFGSAAPVMTAPTVPGPPPPQLGVSSPPVSTGVAISRAISVPAQQAKPATNARVLGTNRLTEPEAARADQETNLKRLELTLAEAETELAYCVAECDAVKSAHQEGRVGEAEARKRQLQRRQAELKLQRAHLELDAAKRRMGKK